MKIHGIIENDCEDLIAIWRTNIELALHRVIWWLSICPSDSYARTRRPRPSSRQEVTMVGHFHSCFTKYSQESNQVYIYDALSNHMLWNFWLKIPGFEPASVDCPDFFESRVNLFIIFSAKLVTGIVWGPLYRGKAHPRRRLTYNLRLRTLQVQAPERLHLLHLWGNRTLYLWIEPNSLTQLDYWRCHIREILVNIKRYLKVTIGRKALCFHHAFYEIIDTGFVVLTPSISILFTLGQFVAQNHTISVNRLIFLER